MKKILLFLALGIFVIGNTVEAKNNAKSKKDRKILLLDTLNYKVLSGKVVNSATDEPVVFANVYLNGESIGTVTNADGEFLLKIPKKSKSQEIAVTYLGYKNKVIGLNDLASTSHIIKLMPLSIPIDEVVIKSMDPATILRSAITQIKTNYSLIPEMQTAFYRETIKKNRNYVSIAEAVLDIYKSGYRNSFDFDRVKIYKGRKSSNVDDMDTLLVKLQGGPRTSLLLDAVKNPGDLLDVEAFSFYNYHLSGMTSINNRNCYVIGFDQKPEVQYPLYKGKIYVDAETYAISGFDFQFSPYKIEEVANFLVRKKPAGLDLDYESGNYLVNYREINGKWYLNYVRSELVFKAKWDQRLFRKNITTMFEMAVTDRDLENVEKIPYKVSSKYTDFLSDDIVYFQDDSFWGDYNVIKPDVSIEVAIEKLGKQLKRRDK